jgi:molybdopterin molybdotransferase
VTSAQVVMFILIVPFLRYLSNDRQYLSQRYFPITYAYLTENVPSKRGREEYVRVRLIQDKDKILAEPIFSKSGLIKSLVKAQGLLKIPSSTEGILKGSFVQILLI